MELRNQMVSFFGPQFGFGISFVKATVNPITMKKYLIVCAACLLVSAARSQGVGIKGGLSLATISNYGSTGDTRVSGNVGLYFHSRISSNWALQPEVLYSGEGVKYKSVLGADRTLALSYIQVPVMLQFSPVRMFYIEFGPQLGILASANVKDDNNNKTSVMDGYNSVSLSLNAGAGFHVTRQLGFFARYSFGLTDITQGDNQTYYSNVGQLGMTVRLN